MLSSPKSQPLYITFCNSGHMCTGYKTIGTKTYYLEEKEGKDYGKLVTEPTGTWKQKGENWYYINNKTGFPEIGSLSR